MPGSTAQPQLSLQASVAAWLGPVVAGYLASQGVEAGPELTLERPARPEHGDLSVNLPMQLARVLRRPPLEIAKELAALVPLDGPASQVEVAPPGFINLRLSPAWLFESLRGIVDAGKSWGRSDLGRGEKVQVEFVSTNPTGPLLISHGRGAVVGDTIARLLEHTGHAVQREFYINDAGRQVQLFGASILAARQGEPPPEDGYVGDYIRELAAELPDQLMQAAKDELTQTVTAWGVKRYIDEFERDLRDIGIGFDTWFTERALYGPWEEETLAELEAAGRIARHDGAVWLVLPDGKEEVVYRSSGEGTYFWGDLLYHRDKFLRRGMERVVDIWGADHQNQVRRMKQAMEVIGVDPDHLQVVLIQLVHMRRGTEFVKVSKRSGNLVLLRDLVEEVGPDAVRYHYLLRSNDTSMDFDLDLARSQSNENPVFYAQYAHARLCSVRAVAAEAGVSPDPAGLELLGAPGEVALARELLDFPDVVATAARELAPHHLPHYAQRLAERIHGFYHAGNRDGSLRVVVPDRRLASARLYLCEAARLTIAGALGVMGVTAPEKM
jgi:arginyl-tRNA synthetase